MILYDPTLTITLLGRRNYYVSHLAELLNICMARTWSKQAKTKLNLSLSLTRILNLMI